MNPQEKRKLTILKKREKKEKAKEAHAQKIVSKHQEHLSKLKDVKNVNAYAKVLQRFNKYKNKHILNTGIRYKGKDIIQIVIHERMHQDQILDIVNKMSKDLGKMGEGFIDLSVKGDRWYFQGQSSWGSTIKFHDKYDELNDDTFDSFAIYLSALPSSEGGLSQTNDCLYDALFECLGIRLLKVWAEPTDLKKFLKINYTSKVDISHLEAIEKKLNCSINCSGDYLYSTKIQSNKIINLQIISEHYTLLDDRKDIFKFNVKLSRRERNIMMYRKTEDKNSGEFFTCYDGKDTTALSKEMRSKIYKWETNYILVDVFEPKMTLKENYDLYIRIADELKEKTNGKINLYKTGDFKKTALHLFSETTKHINHPSNPNQAESEMLMKASQGSIIFNTKGYEGEAWKADVISMYPSIMSDVHQLFPIKEGELKYLDKFPYDYFENGIYRAIVTDTTNTNKKIFRFNYDNHYTNIDLTRAKELNLNIELIVDGQPNFLYYSRDKCLTGSEIFGEYVNLLYPLKNDCVLGAKQILNVLWGALCERNIKHKIHKNGDVSDIPDNVRPQMRPYDDDGLNTIVDYVRYEKQNLYGWSRIKPFILAKGRSKISKIMEPYKDSLIRCHTDGILLSNEPTDIKYGFNIGDLRFEGYYKNISIHSSTGKVNYD
jgi:hypothetical protein